MKDHDIYISTAIQELIKPTFEVTKQYLQVMDVEFDKNSPKVARVDLDHTNESIAVYFYIKDERFYIVVNLSKAERPAVEWVWMESGHRVYLTATSDELKYDKLSRYLPLEPLTGWSKGDI